MDAPFADLLFLLLALATIVGLVALAKVFEKVTAESARTARAADPTTAGSQPGAGTPGPRPTTPDTTGEARA